MVFKAVLVLLAIPAIIEHIIFSLFARLIEEMTHIAHSAVNGE